MASRLSVAAAAALVLAAQPALAHVGHGAEGGLAHGFFHPLGGLDHLLAMVAVGFWAAQIGGHARFALPAAFVLVMVLGGGLGFLALPGAAIEYGIAGSVLVLGGLIALAVRLPLLAGALLVGGFGFVHGYAHGAEMPAGTAPLAYGIGFVLATALLHVVGLALGQLVQTRLPARVAGAAVAAAGAFLVLAV